MLPTQKYLLKLLLEIDGICKRHGISYILGFGTLLGAVRHEGFIPWDNDLDIIMDWDNYNKFRDACEQELDGVTRTLQDNRYNREFSVCCGHYTDLTTCRMSSRTVFWEPLCGQYIDIFVASEMPGDIELMRQRYNKYCAYDEYANRVYLHQTAKTPEIIDIYQGFLKREKEIGRLATLEELEAEMFNHHYDDCTYCFANNARTGTFIAFMPKSILYDVIEVPFEGHLLPIPRDWSAALTWWYSDTYNLFPRNERVHSEMSHSGLPAACYVNDYMGFLDRDEIVDTLDKFKEAGVENGGRLGDERGTFYKAQGFIVGRRMQKKFDALAKRDDLDFDNLLASTDAKSLEALNPVVHEFLGKQLNQDCKNYRTHLDVPVELEEAAWRVAAYWRFNLYAIDHLAAIRWYNQLEFTDAMKEVIVDVARLRNVRKGLLYGNLDSGIEDLKALKEKLPWMQQVKVYDLRYRFALAETNDDIEQCLSMADDILQAHPKNESCKKARADALLALGRIDEANAIYDELEAVTNDGLILLDIQKKRAANGSKENR